MNVSIAKLENQLVSLKRKLEIIDDSLKELNIVDRKFPLTVGCRVLVTWEIGNSREGRVLLVQQHRVLINRDGYSGGIWVDLNDDLNILPQTINLSVGTYGTLEKEQWLLNKGITEKEGEIEKEIYHLIKGIKENLKTEIAHPYVDQIIQLKEFGEWYRKNNFDSAVSL
jgi:hypothetical protein